MRPKDISDYLKSQGIHRSRTSIYKHLKRGWMPGIKEDNGWNWWTNERGVDLTNWGGPEFDWEEFENGKIR